MSGLPDDLTKLEAEISRVYAMIDTYSPSDRAAHVDRLRTGLVATGISITADDEKVFSLFVEGVLDSRHLGDHFGPRLFDAAKKGR